VTHTTDPALLSPADREAELARLLAVGLLRRRWPADHPAPGGIDRISSESGENPLALPPERSVTVHGG
jgi:hypothetical protein